MLGTYWDRATVQALLGGNSQQQRTGPLEEMHLPLTLALNTDVMKLLKNSFNTTGLRTDALKENLDLAPGEKIEDLGGDIPKEEFLRNLGLLKQTAAKAQDKAAAEKKEEPPPATNFEIPGIKRPPTPSAPVLAPRNTRKK
jgi:hypothetical protein